MLDWSSLNHHIGTGDLHKIATRRADVQSEYREYLRDRGPYIPQRYQTSCILEPNMFPYDVEGEHYVMWGPTQRVAEKCARHLINSRHEVPSEEWSQPWTNPTAARSSPVPHTHLFRLVRSSRSQ